jgi:hypothetical protein
VRRQFRWPVVIVGDLLRYYMNHSFMVGNSYTLVVTDRRLFLLELNLFERQSAQDPFAFHVIFRYNIANDLVKIKKLAA